MTNLNEVFGLGREEDGVAGEVLVDDKGWIVFGSRSLTQSEAADLAEKLLTAAQASIYRNQVGSPHFYDSAEILRREISPLGKAIAAARQAF